MKTDLPAILLRGIVLLPNNDIRLEFDHDVSHNIIDVAEMFHENKILVVTPFDPLEETPNEKELPNIGVISKITHKMELPNGKTRVILTGMKRAHIHDYLNLNRSSEVLETIVSEIVEPSIEEANQKALTRKLYREMEHYIKTIPYMSNSVLSLISNLENLSKMTDIIAPHLPISLERLLIYQRENDPSIRSEYILEDIYKEEELFFIEKELDQKVKQEIDQNQREFILREKMKTIKEELGDISLKDDEIEELKQKIEQLEASEKIKKRARKELERYQGMPSMSPEVTIARTYLDWFLNIPWEHRTVDNQDLKKARVELDKSHCGLEEVKTRMIEYLAVKIRTGSLKGPIICLVGPPGVGKTSLAFRIASALHRKFVKISVGGVSDESEILGHRRTYLGANPGRIIQSMKKAGTNNPVFLIDEIDKMTHDYHGDPASALLSVLDPEQNQFFSDNYIEEEFDLSQVLFILTANYIDQIPEALRDRLEIITLSGYTEYEKLEIAKQHLIPKLCQEHGIDPNFLHFTDSSILSIIRSYTREAGVRELERQIAKICRKIVTKMVMLKVQVAELHITEENLESYLEEKKYHFHHTVMKKEIGVVNGMAYTNYGGDILPIEVNYSKGKGALLLTGSLGEVMKESATIALSYIKANASRFHIDLSKITQNDIHVHVPEGAVPKDGPSAGIALTTSLISALSGIRIPSDLAMTGEITLRGNVLPIGGLKEKSIGAYRAGIKRIIIPFDNISDLARIPTEIKENITYIPVKHYKEVFDLIGGKEECKQSELVNS